MNQIDPFTANVPYHVGTSQFICIANQLTGFYTMENIDRNGLTVNKLVFKIKY